MAKLGQWFWFTHETHENGGRGLVHHPDNCTLLLTDAQVRELKAAPNVAALLPLLFAIVGVGTAANAALHTAFKCDGRTRAEQLEEIRSVLR
jgi:hypothetical protein